MSERQFAVQSAPTSELSAQSDAMARLMIDSIHDYAVFMLDPKGMILSWNVGGERIMGYAAPEIVGRHFSRFYPANHRVSAPRRVLVAAGRQNHHEHEGWLVRKNGKRFWAAVVIEPVYGAEGQHLGFAEVIRDTTAQRVAEETLRRANAELERRVEERTRELNALNVELEELANTDSLTAIHNRRGFMAVARHEMGRSARYNTPFSVLFLDIDKFKAINDTFGHAAGDAVLQMVVQQMGRQLRGGDAMGRIGGDEFVLLLLETTSDQAAVVAKRLSRSVGDAVTEVAGQSFGANVSIGVAQWAVGESMEALLSRADGALYRAKMGRAPGQVDAVAIAID